jgi:hypothetical protein
VRATCEEEEHGCDPNAVRRKWLAEVLRSPESCTGSVLAKGSLSLVVSSTGVVAGKDEIVCRDDDCEV